MRRWAIFASFLVLTSTMIAGCMTQDNLRLAREQPLPPVIVMRAAPEHQYYRNLSIQEIQGAPEFRWFDGGAVLTTRPTRKQTFDLLKDDLDRMDMLADSRVDGEYMLYVKFENLRGPDMIPFTDKRASANITFRLVRWKTGELVKEKKLVVVYEASLGGIPPEVIRNALAGPIGVANDSPFRPPGGSMGAVLFKVYIFDRDTYDREFVGTPTSPSTQIGPVIGTDRRLAAWHGMINLAFDEFMQDLSSGGAIAMKRAVSCDSLNPHGTRTSEIIETRDAYAIDCEDSHYFESKIARVYPGRF